MTDEITEPTLKLCWNTHAIRRAAEVLRAAGLQLMAEDVEAQFPQPAVEEPQEFGSVIRAGIDGLSDRVLWVRGCNYWFSETARRSDFRDLHNPEILRFGVGGAATSNLLEGKSVRVRRFCSLRSDCRMADGHDGGCQP